MRRVVIVGHGVEAWLCAARLARALPRPATEIVVVPTPGSDAWDAVYAVQPLDPSDPLRPLGISDLMLVQECDGSFGLGSQWHDGPVFPYGPTGVDFAGVAFHHHWRRAHPDAGVDSYLRYSSGARALQRGVFAPPVARNAIGSLQHEIARHVDPAALVDLLRGRAKTLGVQQSAAALAAGQSFLPDAPIESIQLANGDRLEALLYIDASGPVDALQAARSARSFCETAKPVHWQFSTRSSTRPSPPPVAFQVRAERGSFAVTVPLQSHDLTLEFLADSTPGLGAPYSTGLCRAPWQHNTLALGQTAARFLPLAALHARCLNHSVNDLLELLPGPHDTAGEAAEYNHRFARDMADVLDLTDWHIDSATHGASASPTLRKRIELFLHRGWVMPTDGKNVTHDEWIGAFIGHRLYAKHVDPNCESLDAATIKTRLVELDRQIGHVVGEFPPLHRYLEVALSTPLRKSTGAVSV